MGFFQEIDEQYFVEEISYDDMMAILEHQNHGHESENLQNLSAQNQEQNAEAKAIPELQQTEQHHIEQKVTKADEIARRIAENANKKLPNWLLNH